MRQPLRSDTKEYRILTCFKVTEDYDEYTLEQWKQIERGAHLGNARKILGCFDEAALETALLEADARRGEGLRTEVCALTVQPGYSDHILSRLFAVGYDDIYCLENREADFAALHFAPQDTARLIGNYIRRLEKERGERFDVVFCGQQASPGNSGLVPAFLGMQLERRVCSWQENSAGMYREPYIAVVGNESCSYLRVPTLREKLNTKNKKPYRSRIPEAEAGGISAGAMPEFKDRHKPRACRQIEEGDIDWLVGYILNQSREQRK